MKKILSILAATILSLTLFGTAIATGPTSATSTSWGAGSTISSAWLNAVGALLSSLTSTSSPLGTISNQATTTGNILVASTTSGWVALAVGSNGQCPVASSSASLGIAWGVCGGSINGTLASSYYLTASGTGFSVSTNGATTTFTIASSSYLQPLNNLSELLSTSTARTNLGLAYSSLLLSANNLSDLVSTSSARTNLGYTGQSGQVLISSTGTIGFATTSVSQFVNDAGYATSGATAAAGVVGNVQYNNNGALAGTSTLSYASGTQTLTVTNLVVPGIFMPLVLVSTSTTSTAISSSTGMNKFYAVSTGYNFGNNTSSIFESQTGILSTQSAASTALQPLGNGYTQRLYSIGMVSGQSSGNASTTANILQCTGGGYQTCVQVATTGSFNLQYLSSGNGSTTALLTSSLLMTNASNSYYELQVVGTSLRMQCGNTSAASPIAFSDASTTCPSGGQSMAVWLNGATTTIATTTITLPVSSSSPMGAIVIVKDLSGTKQVNVVASGTDQIDNLASSGITTAYGELRFDNSGHGDWMSW